MPTPKITLVFRSDEARPSTLEGWDYVETKIPGGLRLDHRHLLQISDFRTDRPLTRDAEITVNSAIALGGVGVKQKQMLITAPFAKTTIWFNPTDKSTIIIFVRSGLLGADWAIEMEVWQPGPTRGLDSPQLYEAVRGVQGMVIRKLCGDGDLTAGRDYRLLACGASHPIHTIRATIGGVEYDLAADGSTYGTFTKGSLGKVQALDEKGNTITDPRARILFSVTPAPKFPDALGIAEVIRLRRRQVQLRADVDRLGHMPIARATALVELALINAQLAPHGFTPL
jgi:hypothetical protein